MVKLLLFSFMVMTFILPSKTFGQSADRPDISGWDMVSERQLEFRANDYTTVFVGLVREYRDPENEDVHVQIFNRHIVLVSERPREDATDPNYGRSALTLGSGTNFHLKRQQDALERVRKSVDPVAYIRWQVTHDERSGQDFLTGKVESWLLDQGNNWVYAPGTKITEAPLTEPSKIDPKKTVIVGLRLSLGRSIHLLRADQNDLLALEVRRKASNAK